MVYRKGVHGSSDELVYLGLNRWVGVYLRLGSICRIRGREKDEVRVVDSMDNRL